MRWRARCTSSSDSSEPVVATPRSYGKTLLVLAFAATGDHERRRGGTQCYESCPHTGTRSQSPTRIYVSVYSGPAPPSGGVSRPPFAVIAPH